VFVVLGVAATVRVVDDEVVRNDGAQSGLAGGQFGEEGGTLIDADLV
jgi:hypothetical protein